MAYKIGYVDDTGSEGSAHWQMLDLIRRFACGYGEAAAPTFSGIGDGTLGAIDTHPDTVTETWTIACTDATTAGAETWSVTGSVSGAQAAATTGVAYVSDYLDFSITTGSTAFAVNDAFSVDTTAGALDSSARWTQMRYDPQVANRELIMKGQGLSGTEEIYIGFRCYQAPTQDYYNMTVAGFTGYVEANDFTSQPGYIERGICAHNQRIDYWLAANAQRIVLGLKIGSPSVYEIGYTGKYYPYATPGQYPYPVTCIGMLPSAMPATRYSNTDDSHGTGVRGNTNRGYLRDVMGNWDQFQCLPWTASYNNAPGFKRDSGGCYLAQPAVMMTNNNVWGELDGIRYISGFNNVSENTTVINGATHVMLADAFRTDIGDYFLLEMS